MAQYEAQCSKVGSFAYSSYFKLYVILTDGEVSGNASKVNYNVYCESSGSGSISSQHFKYFQLNGQEIINKTESVNVSSPNAYIHIASGTTDWIEHEIDGSKKISFTAEIKASSYGVSAKLEETFNLVNIGRYANITFFEVVNIEGADGLTKVKFNWKADAQCDYALYSLDGITWYGLPTTDIVSGLSPNTTYDFRLQVRRADSQLITTSNVVTKATYDISKISEVNNFEHGNDIQFTISNPAAINELSLEMKVNDAQILTRNVTAGSNTIQMTDAELDNLYKQYGTSNSLTAVFILSAGGYIDTKQINILLTGNQKTVYIEGKRGKIWVGQKRAVTWINVRGTWKRGI